jgi:hypothetical protein
MPVQRSPAVVELCPVSQKYRVIVKKLLKRRDLQRPRSHACAKASAGRQPLHDRYNGVSPLNLSWTI